jgi:hypothetical protein
MGTLLLVAPLDSDHVLTDPAQATPVWLTGVLRRDGVLRQGQVESVDVVSRPTPQAGMARLAVRYTAGADPTAPRALRLKLASTGPDPAPSVEVAFYRLVAPRMPD